jgi:ubiquinone/menaquinone biosynthesis C-methylase UbiE
MSAHYDTYDYPSYWLGRDYEHESEIIAIKSLLSKIPKINKVVEIGAGYGRLLPSYIYRANKIILLDPSDKLLNIARKNIKLKKVSFIQSKIENVSNKINKSSIDLVILVRVLHHIKEIDNSFKEIYKILKPNGFLLLEYANKRHLKQTIKQFLKGNITFPIDIFSKDIRSKKNIRIKTLPFINYHPDYISKLLHDNGFIIIEKKSVSNIRIPILKKYLKTSSLLFIEKYTQNIFSNLNIGPSIFLLVRKRI